MAKRASLTAVMIDAKMGADADVPDSKVNVPLIATTIGNLSQDEFKTNTWKVLSEICGSPVCRHVRIGPTRSVEHIRRIRRPKVLQILFDG